MRLQALFKDFSLALGIVCTLSWVIRAVVCCLLLHGELEDISQRSIQVDVLGADKLLKVDCPVITRQEVSAILKHLNQRLLHLLLLLMALCLDASIDVLLELDERGVLLLVPAA